MDLRLPRYHANSGFQFAYAARNVQFSLGKDLSQNGVSREVTRVRVDGLLGVRQTCLVFPALQVFCRDTCESLWVGWRDRELGLPLLQSLVGVVAQRHGASKIVDLRRVGILAEQFYAVSFRLRRAPCRGIAKGAANIQDHLAFERREFA